MNTFVNVLLSRIDYQIFITFLYRSFFDYFYTVAGYIIRLEDILQAHCREFSPDLKDYRTFKPD